MKPDASYYFDLIFGYQTRYMQSRHIGGIIQEFSSSNKRGSAAEKNMRFSHILELGESQVITWLVSTSHHLFEKGKQDKRQRLQ